jgi:hypothetical protein
MLRSSWFRLSVFVVGFALAASSLVICAQQSSSQRGRKYKAPPPTSRIEITVVRDVNAKPIENAAVIFHPIVDGEDRGAMELKTNEDGKTIIEVLPIGGIVRLQVIAHGFQTYGEDIAVDKAEMAISIKMKRPGEQYSIYKNHDAAPDSSQDKPSGTTAPPASQPNSNQPQQPK